MLPLSILRQNTVVVFQVEAADQKVLAITIKNNIDGVYHVWGLQDYDTEKHLIKPVNYVKCESEPELLARFVNHWRQEENIQMLLLVGMFGSLIFAILSIVSIVCAVLTWLDSFHHGDL